MESFRTSDGLLWYTDASGDTSRSAYSGDVEVVVGALRQPYDDEPGTFFWMPYVRFGGDDVFLTDSDDQGEALATAVEFMRKVIDAGGRVVGDEEPDAETPTP